MRRYNIKLFAVLLLTLIYSTSVFSQLSDEGDYIFIAEKELEERTGYVKMGLKGSEELFSIFGMESSSEDEPIYFDPFGNIFYRKIDEEFVEVASIKIYEEYAEITNEEDRICVVPSEKYEATLVRTACDS